MFDTVKSPYSGQMRPRYFNPYETHTFVLHHYMHEIDPAPTKVLELGPGFYSTRLFLSYPVENLLSIENNRVWKGHVLSYLKQEEVIEEHPSDIFQMKLVPDVAKEVELYDLNYWDLIFIDNGQDGHPEERVAAIDQVLGNRPSCPVIIHDYDVQSYRQSVLKHQPDGAFINVFNDFEPYTAVVTFL